MRFPGKALPSVQLFQGLKSSLSPASAPDLPPPPPPVPTRADPAIAAAKKKARLAQLQRKGRRATFFAGKIPEAQLGDAPVVQPRAGSQVLG